MAKETPIKSISVIIPVWNEAKNIKPLVQRIDKTLSKEYTYELIFIDDNSSDTTLEEIISLRKKYPIDFYSKIGAAGKAQSLLEGFRKAQYKVVAMIDADLQYPPERIPSMIEELNKGADVVIADRQDFQASFFRKVASRTFKRVFGAFLHKLPYDIQSGLKVFRKEIVERVKINPSPWTFDMEFLIKARDAGYSITSVPITLSPRETGKTKVNMFSTTLQLSLNAIKLKLSKRDIIPFLKEVELKKGKGFHYKGREFVHHSNLPSHESALYTFSVKQLFLIFTVIAVVIVDLFLDWHTTIVVLIITVTSLYFLDLLFNFFLIFRSFQGKSEIEISAEEIEDRNKRAWPKYTIFCPLYKEWSVVPQFVQAIKKLDYPEAKLQVMLLLEEEDKQTIQEIKKFKLPDSFSIVIVPDSKPKTKPKACNYGLLQADGEYVVIYDAEDIPDPDQLKKSVIAFEKSAKNVVCIQAKLNFYNPHHNLLTRIFTAEYSLWFDLVLTGLQAIGAPIPLGGTSNHFRKKDLINLNGWDSFNVTEDCDLGIRLAKNGYKTEIIESLTLEEANSDWKNWFWQRTRWIKGYFQTYLVHMRRPKDFIDKKQAVHLFNFQIVVGGKVFSMLINPLMWVITIAYFAQRTTWGPFIETFFPGPILYIGTLSLVFGNFLYLYYYMIGCASRKHYSLIKFAFIVPFYWLLMSVAAWTALYKLIKEPHFWSKTKHGLHLQNVKATAQTKHSIKATKTNEEDTEDGKEKGRIARRPAIGFLH